jgi:hypothetical protein
VGLRLASRNPASRRGHHQIPRRWPRRFGRGVIGTTNLLVNWGMLLTLVAAILVLRHHAKAQIREPLPPPPPPPQSYLSAAQVREWHAFPPYHRVVPVLLYHGNDSANGGLSIQWQLFAQQMLALRTAGFHAITLDQYLKYARGSGRGLPSRPVLITIDGGHLGTYRAVSNILRLYGFHVAVFTSPAWPATSPGAQLTWSALRAMQGSGIWSVQEQGGHPVPISNAMDSGGGEYALRRYANVRPRQRRLQSFRIYSSRMAANDLWREDQLAAHIPGYRPLSVAIPQANHGQRQAGYSRIQRLTLPWLRQHFQIVFGGDYLDRGPAWPHKITARFSRALAYRVSVDPRTSLTVLDCRLRDWVTRSPIWMESRCLRSGTAWRDPETWGFHPRPRQAGGSKPRMPG